MPQRETRVAVFLQCFPTIARSARVGQQELIKPYNFTDFSDDLTDLSYDHQGAFVNLIGTW